MLWSYHGIVRTWALNVTEHCIHKTNFKFEVPLVICWLCSTTVRLIWFCTFKITIKKSLLLGGDHISTLVRRFTARANISIVKTGSFRFDSTYLSVESKRSFAFNKLKFIIFINIIINNFLFYKNVQSSFTLLNLEKIFLTENIIYISYRNESFGWSTLCSFWLNNSRLLELY